MMQINSPRAMQNEPGKLLRLFFLMLGAVLGIVAILLLLFLLMRVVFGVLTYLPWLEYLYVIFILSVPSAIFLTAFSVFFNRTRKHPAKFVKAVSLVIISLFLAAWAVFYVWDIITFIRFQYTEISHFKSYNMLFLFSNVACIFFLGVAQALSMPAEKDWMDRRRDD